MKLNSPVNLKNVHCINILLYHAHSGLFFLLLMNGYIVQALLCILPPPPPLFNEIKLLAR